MGSPISSIIAEAVLQQLERIAMTRNQPKFWARYVDDTFVIIKRSQKAAFVEALNSVYVDLRFTEEEEHQGELAFLDILVQRQPDGSLATRVYRKPTCTNRILHYYSNHPVAHKVSCVKTLFRRADSHCSTAAARMEERKRLFHLCRCNGYPTGFIKRYGSGVPQPPRIPSGPTPVRTTRITLPYVSNVSEATSRLLAPYGVQVAHRPDRTLRSCVMRPKDPLPVIEKSGVIYKINCNDCPKNYVGETSKRIGTRMQEHKLAIRRGEQYSQVLTHMLEHGHAFDFDSVRVVASDPSKSGRLLKEAWFSDSMSINRHVDLRPAYQTMRTWGKRIHSRKQCFNAWNFERLVDEAQNSERHNLGTGIPSTDYPHLHPQRVKKPININGPPLHTSKHCLLDNAQHPMGATYIEMDGSCCLEGCVSPTVASPPWATTCSSNDAFETRLNSTENDPPYGAQRFETHRGGAPFAIDPVCHTRNLSGSITSNSTCTTFGAKALSPVVVKTKINPIHETRQLRTRRGRVLPIADSTCRARDLAGSAVPGLVCPARARLDAGATEETTTPGPDNVEVMPLGQCLDYSPVGLTRGAGAGVCTTERAGGPSCLTALQRMDRIPRSDMVPKCVLKGGDCSNRRGMANTLQSHPQALRLSPSGNELRRTVKKGGGSEVSEDRGGCDEVRKQLRNRSRRRVFSGEHGNPLDTEGVERGLREKHPRECKRRNQFATGGNGLGRGSLRDPGDEGSCELDGHQDAGKDHMKAIKPVSEVGVNRTGPVTRSMRRNLMRCL